MGIGNLHVCTHVGAYIDCRLSLSFSFSLSLSLPLSLSLSLSSLSSFLSLHSFISKAFLSESQEREASELLHHGHGIAYEIGGAQKQGERIRKKKKEKTNLWNGGWLWF